MMKPSRAKPPPRTPAGLGYGRTPIRTPLRTPATARPRALLPATHKDPVEVFCRVRPNSEEEETCIRILSDTTVQLTPPESSRAFTTGKETQYTFKSVFGEESGQSEVFQRVGLPLVEDLLEGKNGLLFTYGVTGSGKTHTMQGTLQDGGIMNRVVDVVFNSISHLQTQKFRLKPDKLNGFEIISDVDAIAQRQSEVINTIKNPRARRQNSSDPDLSSRVPESHRVAVDEDAQYAIFISYVEVYNNYTYDLLETPVIDIVTGKPKLLSKVLREDSYRNMYVHGVTEVEVKSPEEALEAFYRGQKQRKVAQTLLNHNSSRSHSIFNIRIVSVPYDPVGEDILADACVLTVSQLALVDLAGSERSGRTGNTGDRLAEASKINQSLMALRCCIETLRENQQTGSNKMVPYRESRVTYLFRNYFEGEGKVKMIVCVNPRASDFDENINVMKFAELTQEVQIERPAAVKFDLGLTPGRRRGNQIYKEAIKRLEHDGFNAEDLPGLDLMPIYNLGPGWPSLELTQCDDEETIERLKTYLEKRIATRATLMEDHYNKRSAFRDLLKKQDDEVILLRNENTQLKSQLEAERKRARQIETRLANAEAANRSLNDKVNAFADMRLIMENELDEKELQLNAEQKERIRTRQKYKQKLLSEREKISSELDKKLELQRLKTRVKATKTLAKLNELNQLVTGENTIDSNDENIENGAVRVGSQPDLSCYQERGRTSLKTSSSDPRMSSSSAPRPSIAVANARHRRSQSAGADTWLDHRPREGVLPLGTVLQPVLNRRKSVTRLEERDLVNARTNKYLLTTQNQVEGGDVVTRLYKGDVVPTISGGRQVVFNDVEVLTQESPTESPRKRSYEEFRGVSARIADMEGRCGYGMEGHPATPMAARSRGKRSRY